jgi:hypothetical protein
VAARSEFLKGEFSKAPKNVIAASQCFFSVQSCWTHILQFYWSSSILIIAFIGHHRAILDNCSEPRKMAESAAVVMILCDARGADATSILPIRPTTTPPQHLRGASDMAARPGMLATPSR